MMVSDLSEREKNWLKAYLSCDFPGKEEVIQQIKTSTICRKHTKWYLSIKFYPDRSLASAPTIQRVPVIMLAHLENRAPLQFMLHIISGYVDEMEILFADSAEISDRVDIAGAKLEYIF